MAYETSYDSGLTPFKPDRDRGKWSSPRDFIFACLGHAFKLDAVVVFPAVLFADLGIYTLIPYLLTLGLCVVPIVFMQSFLGQFSSSGFISVFRLSPLFKGIGYVSLAINLTSLTYYALLGAVPLFYFFHTLTPVIPWSCEGAETWMYSEENRSSICNYKNQSYVRNRNDLEIPSVEFLNVELNTMTMYHRSHPEGQFSWSVMICTFIIWGIVAIIAIKPIESIGKFLRYSCITVLGIMGLCLIRFLFLPGALNGLSDLLHPKRFSEETFIFVPLMAFSALGPGWGSVLTMASYNKFETNIYRYSWLLCVAQGGVLIGLGLLSICMKSFLESEDPKNIDFLHIHTQWMEFLTIPTGLTFLELPHIWSLLFFTMIILGCINLLIVQLFSVLTSLFDEFEIVRSLKREMTLATVGIMALASIFFCSNYGITFFETFMQVSLVSQLVLNLLLLIVVVWIYGRERFQRDVCFMTNRTYSTCMVNVMRYIAPFFIFLAWIVAILFALIYLHKLSVWGMISFIAVTSILPWLLIPGYCIFKILQTSGGLGTRFRRCLRPTDWYPVDPMDRRRYEERFSETEISHNLSPGNIEIN